MTLTEKWKKGELEQGYYYTRYNPKVGEPFVEIELRNYLLDLAKVRDAETVEVLAPVPSYEEYLRLGKKIKNRCIQIQKVTSLAFKRKKEIKKLKELLKECRTMIGQFEVDNPRPRSFDAINMLIKIDNAIGEKEIQK